MTNGTNNEPCPCTANFTLRLKHIGSKVLLLVVRVLVLSLALAYLMSILNALQYWGMAPMYLPFSGVDQFRPGQDAAGSAEPIVTAFDNFVYLYNCAFPGASRLGSGIGMIFACFWTLHSVDRNCRAPRIALGALCGAIIGFRLILMLSSSATGVLSSMIVSSIGFAIYMAIADRKPGIPSLPIVQPE